MISFFHAQDMTSFEKQKLYNKNKLRKVVMRKRMIIYLDVIFLENLCMNYIILFATGLIHRVKIKQWRCFVSSLIGGLYAVISMMEVSDIYGNFFLKIGLSVAMIYIAFLPKTPKLLCKELLIFYLTSFAFGGCAFALLYFVRPEEVMIKDGVLIGSYPIKIALLGGVVGFTIIVNAFRIVKGKMNKKDMFCEMKITFYGKSKQVKAMIDTGNMLKDPISRFPVVVVEKHALECILPSTILEHTEEMISGKNEIVWEEIEDPKYLSKFRMIPFTSVGKQHGILMGFKADEVIVYQEEENVWKNVIVGIFENKLSKEDTYQALIGLEMLGKEEKQNELVNSIKI